MIDWMARLANSEDCLKVTVTFTSAAACNSCYEILKGRSCMCRSPAPMHSKQALLLARGVAAAAFTSFHLSSNLHIML